MAMAASTLPYVSLQQHKPSKLPLSVKRRGAHFILQQLRSPCKRPLRGRLHLRRPSELVPRANAETASLQEEEAQDQPPISPAAEEDEAMCREILQVVNILNEKRDMPFNEVRLTIMIEDPTEEEQRKQYGVENERGCSRKELAAALVDVYEGKIPSDRNILQELYKEMVSWPNFEEDAESRSDPAESPYARTTDTGMDPRVVAQKMKVDFDEAAEIQPGAEDKPNLPPVFGFGVLYVVTAIPILIGIAVVVILYVNSFR